MTNRKFASLKSDDGFTLIEALVATALMAMILGALATITSQWLPNWNRGIARLQRNESVALGLDRMTSDIAAAEFLSPRENTSKLLFDGTSTSITFVRTALGPHTSVGLEIVRIAEIKAGQTSSVVRSKASFKNAAPDVFENTTAFVDPVVLLRAPYVLSISYAGPDRIWLNSWRQKTQLPIAVKFDLYDAGTRRLLPESVAVRLHSEIPSECIGAKSLGECMAGQLQPSATAQNNFPSSRPSMR